MITPISAQNYYNYKNFNYKTNKKQNTQNITYKKQLTTSKIVSPISISTEGNITRISFAGKLKDPSVPAIQMKLRGVTHHQNSSGKRTATQKDASVEKLAASDWQDGKKLDYQIAKFEGEEKILIFDRDFGEIGRVPDEVAPSVLKLLKKHGDDFQFELANVIAGMDKGAPTIGLRINFLYKGDNDKVKDKAERTFDFLLNSDTPEVADVILPFQPVTSPKEVLKRIFDHEGQTNGPEAAREISEIIKTISDEINNPKNKNILLLGHCMPDGDTIGCVLGMQAAIKSAYPDRNVQCSIDDKIPGIYRDKLPGINNIKRVYDKTTIQRIKDDIEALRQGPMTPEAKRQIDIYEDEIRTLSRNENIFNPEAKDSQPPKQYDLVILMDVPSPSRFTSAYKDYIQNAGKVIYIDHHPIRYDEWMQKKDTTGIDLLDVKDQKLSLITPAVPACAQLVTVIADNAGLLEKTMRNEELAKQYTAAVVSGLSSDTGSFYRSANLTPDDIKQPFKLRPNFRPEGLAKWLIAKLGSSIDKKWIRENIVYDIPDKADKISGTSPREKMIKYALDSLRVYPREGIGFINIDYDKMREIWLEARKQDKKVTLSDVQNSLKYCEVMGALRNNTVEAERDGLVLYRSKYDDDKIAVLLIQDKQKGKPDDNSQIAKTNSIRMSFRSKEGTNYAEILSYLFGGGGHAAAAGGRITFDGVTLNSKINVKIDGEIERNPETIYKKLKENYQIKHNKQIDERRKLHMLHTFEPIPDENGSKITDLIAQVTKAIRKEIK